MLERGTVVRLKVTEGETLAIFTKFDNRIAIILGPGKNYDGPNKSNMYEVLVGTDKMSILETSLEVV